MISFPSTKGLFMQVCMSCSGTTDVFLIVTTPPFVHAQVVLVIYLYIYDITEHFLLFVSFAVVGENFIFKLLTGEWNSGIVVDKRYRKRNRAIWYMEKSVWVKTEREERQGTVFDYLGEASITSAYGTICHLLLLVRTSQVFREPSTKQWSFQTCSQRQLILHVDCSHLLQEQRHTLRSGKVKGCVSFVGTSIWVSSDRYQVCYQFYLPSAGSYVERGTSRVCASVGICIAWLHQKLHQLEWSHFHSQVEWSFSTAVILWVRGKEDNQTVAEISCQENNFIQ